LFRIDRSFVKLGSTKRINVGGTEEETEVDARGEILNAAASATYMEAEDTLASAQDKLTNAQDTLNSAKLRSEEMLEAAREEVAAMLHQAQEEIEESKRQAWEEGYAEGAEEGKHSFDEQLTEKIREDDEMLKRVISELQEERDRTFAGLEEDVVALSLDIVRKVIHPSEEAAEGVFESMIRNALRQLSPDGKVIIRVSPAEHERFFDSGSISLDLAGGVTTTVSVLRDISLNSGDLIIDTDEETINAGVDSQLKYIKLAFEKANPPPDQTPNS